MEQFGKLRSFLFPIYKHEFKKLVPMFIMLFFICFNYTVLRNLKDAIVITAENSGAEVIPFIKVWVMLPAAIGATMLFTFLSNRLKQTTVFYLVIGAFISYYMIFAFCIHPFHELLRADSIAHFFETLLPKGAKGFVSMIQNWHFTLFYVMCELWSPMVLAVLFWGFANQITKLDEAPRFYSTLNISSNTSSVIAGQVAVLLTASQMSGWKDTVDNLTLLIFLSGLGIMLTYYFMEKPLPTEKIEEKKKNKLSFSESISHVASSKTLFWIAVLVISYNLVIHMVEVIWKDQLKELYPNPNDYNVYMNNLTSVMGIISTLLAFLMVGIINKCGWIKTALITPIVLLTTTSLFFGSMFTAIAPVGLAVLLGSAQNIFTKAAKYTLFDTTKEMAFIPLDPDLKLKGKAAIDGIGSRLGKSGGSLLHQGLLIIFGTLSASTPVVACILLAVIALWIYGVKTLGSRLTPVQAVSP